MTQKFSTTLAGGPEGPTGIVVPSEVIEALGAGKKPALHVEVNGYRYRTTVGFMKGTAMLPFSSDHRKASGLNGGDAIDVVVSLATAPEEFEMPEALATALDAAGKRAVFDKLAPSKRKEFCRQVREAKAEDTRVRRVEKVLESLG